MLGIEIKRATVSTFERVSAQQDLQINRVLWQGETAGIIREDKGIVLMFPNLDDSSDFPKKTLHRLVGYAAHELGHLWFTDRDPWDKATEVHGEFLGRLINGLEDPRIERLVYESGRVPNSRNLFEFLINEVATGNYDPDDVLNYPFFLALDGRRLNGYPITVPPVIERSIHAGPLLKAMNAAHKATSTEEIVQIAIELLLALNLKNQSQLDKQSKEEKKGKEGKEGKEGEESKEGEQEEGNQKISLKGFGKGRERAIPVEVSMHMEIDDCVADRKLPRPLIDKPLTYKFPWEGA